MANREAPQISKLEIRPSRPMNGCIIVLTVIMAIGLPYGGWTEFGPGAAGDTSVNGNSIWAFWFMRIVLAIIWGLCLKSLWHSINLLRRDPLLFVLDEIGITDRKGITTPWTEISRGYYVRRGGTLFLQTRPRSGFAAMETVKAFIREHAHSDMACDF